MSGAVAGIGSLLLLPELLTRPLREGAETELEALTALLARASTFDLSTRPSRNWPPCSAPATDCAPLMLCTSRPQWRPVPTGSSRTTPRTSPRRSPKSPSPTPASSPNPGRGPWCSISVMAIGGEPPTCRVAACVADDCRRAPHRPPGEQPSVGFRTMSPQAVDDTGSRTKADDPRYQRLLEATRAAAREGYDAVSMRKLADTCRLSMTTIYQFCHSKDQLIAEAHADTMRSFREGVIAKPSLAATPADRVRRAIRHFVDPLEQEPVLTRTLMPRCTRSIRRSMPADHPWGRPMRRSSTPRSATPKLPIARGDQHARPRDGQRHRRLAIGARRPGHGSPRTRPSGTRAPAGPSSLSRTPEPRRYPSARRSNAAAATR